ncbi:glycosyltransferase family 4 protein [Gluconacetobacter takamatsuzukensis]|uniref:Glycosyltransferase family 4 protein n=1 Tax=Gluconacetobacter takamatsuzukensis TaxID=1286190 RepID=A0A7W4KG18_9PROT|nr:glycosyltransferase family 4 protein [Gluconacetobacter takamatsuzukensis]MBB2206210.1 glycosyltransferase family 4 protein [Gluconacetobacter takamatsuzukensis]
MAPVLTVLPPRERFAPGQAGAIGLLVHRLAGPGDIVVGPPVAAPFADVAFRAASSPRWALWPRSAAGCYAAAVARVVRQVRPALVEIHNRPDIALALARRFPGLPISVTLHNDPRAMRGAASPARRAALARRMQVVAVSDWVRQCFAEGLPDAAVAVMPNCIDIASLPAPVPMAARDRTILFAGRVVADKGADAFVAACGALLPHLPGWRACMIGADRFGDDSPETPFLRTLRPAARVAGVEMAGYRPHDRVLAEMARAAIVVVPSRWAEPFGLTALEAMGCGAALVASPVGGLRDLVGDAAILAPPDPVAGLAAAIGALAASPGRRAALSALGRARAASFDCVAARARLADLRRAAIAAR